MMFGRGELSVTVRVGQFRVSPRPAMTLVGAVTVSELCPASMSYASWAYSGVTAGRVCQNPSVNFTV